MSADVCVLLPAATYLPGLESGELRLEQGDHRIVRSESGEIVASLVPGKRLEGELARRPLKFAIFARPSRIKARVCGMPMSVSS